VSAAAGVNTPYNQCGSVQAECEFLTFSSKKVDLNSVTWNKWGNQDCYDLSEVNHHHPSYIKIMTVFILRQPQRAIFVSILYVKQLRHSLTI
jgi:hypothetical protein